MGLFGRDDKTTSQPPAPQPAASRPPVKQQPQPQPRSGEVTLVAVGSRLEGRLLADNDVEVKGEIHGSVEGKGQALVAEGARVEAALHARVVVIAGQLLGDVSADDKIELRPSANLRGNLTAPRIVIQDGATFDGQVFMQKPDAKKSTPAASTDPTPTTASAPNPDAAPAPKSNDAEGGRPPRNRH